MISMAPANFSPVATARRVKVLSPVLTKTIDRPSSSWTDSSGTTRARRSPPARGRPLDVHPRLQTSSGVGDLDAAFDRPGRGVDDVGDEDEPAAELFAGISVDLQDDLAARLGGTKVLLLDVEAGPERRRVGQAKEARAELDGVAGDDPAFENGARERRPDGEQRHGHGLAVEGLDLGGRKAQKLQAFAGPGEDGPGRPLLRRVAGVPLGPGGRLDVFRLHAQEIRAVDLGQKLALADAVALDREHAFEPSRRPGREIDEAAGVPLELARGRDPPGHETHRHDLRLDVGRRDGLGRQRHGCRGRCFGDGGLGRAAGLGGALGAAAGDENEGRQGGPDDHAGDRFHAILHQFADSPATSRSARARL